jgi:catechol 2,3-dioxygenase-like lactoylglutathione lyase family enzyme
LWKARLTYRITDFYPECLIAARERRSLVLEMLLALTHFWRRRIDGFEVLGEDQRRRLRATGVAEKRIALVRDGSPVTFAAGQAGDALPTDLAGFCVLLYSGNYGVAHEVDTVVEGYRQHHRQGTGRVRLWLSAAGSGAAEVTERLREQSLPFHKSDPVPLERLAALLSTPDAHLIALKDNFVGYVIPSKVYACLESKRSVIFVGSAESDVELLARGSSAGYWRVPCGDPAGFAATMEDLADQACRSRYIC